MTRELERDLRALGEEIAYPATPELASPVRARIGRPRRRSPRSLAWVLAALALAAAAALAIPPARSAILRFLQIGAVRVERVDELPENIPRGPLHLGERVTLSEAAERVSFTPRLPSLLRTERVYVASYPPGGRVALVYGSPERPRLLLTQFRGTQVDRFAHKAAGRGTTVEAVRVGRRPGLWISGAPHSFVYVDERGRPAFEPLRLARNALIWESGGLTLRLEADISLDEALRIARSVR